MLRALIYMLQLVKSAMKRIKCRMFVVVNFDLQYQFPGVCSGHIFPLSAWLSGPHDLAEVDITSLPSLSSFYTSAILSSPHIITKMTI